MADLDERLRNLFDASPPVSLREVRERSMSGAHGNHPQRVRLVVVVSVAVMMLAATLAIVASRGSGPRLHPSDEHRKTGQRATLTIRIELAGNRVRAGDEIHGTVLIDNTTGKKITVKACAADGWLIVGLANSHVRFDSVSPGIACNPSVQLKAGPNRFPVTISTRYMACTQKSHPTVQLPLCTSSGMPPLPSGRYVTKIITVGLPARTQLPSPIRVTLLPPSAQRLRICRTAQLRVRLVGPGAATGTAGYTAELTNTSSAACTLDGYPRVLLRNDSGRTILRFVPGAAVMALPDPASPTLVTVTAGGKAQFRFAASDVLANANNGAGAPCPSSSEAVITPPGNSSPLVVHGSFGLCVLGGVAAVTRLGVGP